MTILADASAIVAIIIGEPGADALADRLDRDDHRLISAIGVWEAVAALRKSYGLPIGAARLQVRRYLDKGGFEYAPIGAREYELAVEAYARYGKGRHRAALNMGDCFSYACARANDAALLYTGNDFARTDLA